MKGIAPNKKDDGKGLDKTIETVEEEDLFWKLK